MLGNNNNARTFTVNISTLLTHLRENRGKHQEVVEEAQEAFRKRAIVELDRMLNDAKVGREIQMHIGLAVPTSHIREYDNAIGILTMTSDAGEAHVEITADEYDRFVDDNWHWKQQFVDSNTAYSGKAAEFYG